MDSHSFGRFSSISPCHNELKSQISYDLCLLYVNRLDGLYTGCVCVWWCHSIIDSIINWNNNKHNNKNKNKFNSKNRFLFSSLPFLCFICYVFVDKATAFIYAFFGMRGIKNQEGMNRVFIILLLFCYSVHVSSIHPSNQPSASCLQFLQYFLFFILLFDVLTMLINRRYIIKARMFPLKGGNNIKHIMCVCVQWRMEDGINITLSASC